MIPYETFIFKFVLLLIQASQTGRSEEVKPDPANVSLSIFSEPQNLSKTVLYKFWMSGFIIIMLCREESQQLWMQNQFKNNIGFVRMVRNSIVGINQWGRKQIAPSLLINISLGLLENFLGGKICRDWHFRQNEFLGSW